MVPLAVPVFGIPLPASQRIRRLNFRMGALNQQFIEKTIFGVILSEAKNLSSSVWHGEERFFGSENDPQYDTPLFSTYSQDIQRR